LIAWLGGNWSAEAGVFGGGLILIGFGTALIIPLFGVSRALDLFRECREIRADAGKAAVHCFQGQLPGIEAVREMIETARQDGEIVQPPVVQVCGVAIAIDGPTTLEIHELSQTLWSVNSLTVSTRTALTLQNTAPPPPEAQSAARWAERVSLQEDQKYDLTTAGRRPLDSSEINELERASSGECARALSNFLLSSLFCGIPLVILAIGEDKPASDWFFWVFALALGGFYVHSGRCYYNSVLLTRDAREGQVVVAHFPQDIKLLIPEHGAILEILPHTGREWTRDGRPSPGRLDQGL
jgi:hypothetical protein